eukprot:CAMPEP_0184232368 /NCGR_PEP_ID=MMETSP0976-20121227/23751_1 /TAXON_ID=483370 /ORGANISM="non described non described, Strain CCMP2097" /LENGTH=38 /DNA_ID= /DNA_START= /DNA_END= /DNA_ORIENTATION=
MTALPKATADDCSSACRSPRARGAQGPQKARPGRMLIA